MSDLLVHELLKLVNFGKGQDNDNGHTVIASLARQDSALQQITPTTLRTILQYSVYSPLLAGHRAEVGCTTR